jgi:outer membrane protein OmpA-like peptidoglycan-associated protein
MRVQVLLMLMLWVAGLPLRGRAQAPAAGQTYTDARTGYRLTYPGDWLVHQSEGQPGVGFYAGPDWASAPARVSLSIRPLPAGRAGQTPLERGLPDSLWRSIVARPQARVLQLAQQEAGSHQEVRYDYTYAAGGAARTHVLGRRLWRGGYEYELEYRAAGPEDARYLRAGRQLVESFVFVGKGPSGRRSPAQQPCDDKMYGIAALRINDGQWEDDCRSIHEFSVSNPSAAPKQHRQVLPFQSYALAKGFDNCLYAVTKAPTDAPERVYRYNPATRQGDYTNWQLPAQGPENVWISAATDEQGDLYFITNDANLLVRVSPATDAVQVVWSADPLRKAPYYPAIGFPGAGTHANFCLDDAGSLYEVYSTDGSLVKIDLKTQQPGPELMPIGGLPERGGYSDLLMQHDAAGRQRLYLAGPKALYEVDLGSRQATRVRRGVYTDLAGCNLFRLPPPPAKPPTAPTTVRWRGRVLDALTYQPLPLAQLKLHGALQNATVALSSAGEFTFTGPAGYPVGAEVQLAGYLAVDSLHTPPPGFSAHDILLRPLAVGATLPLDNVQFEQGQAVLLASSFGALDQLAGLLTQNPGLTIELRGHTDNVGDAAKNVALSEERVAVVKAYLVTRGVAAERISGRGLGGAEPRASNEREETRRLNRRVEVRVTGR